jgi:hypothetical protein
MVTLDLKLLNILATCLYEYFDCLQMMTVVPNNCKMKDLKIGDQIADIQDGAVHGIREHNFLWLDLVMRNQNGCSNAGYKNLNLIQTPSWRNLCSFVHKIN